ncbi:hypothetical protein J2Z40_001023 [Cytobacillus eiseniae]|uniref:Uncharacterized protein n=1 Tax=Cytobacillus eiseniae TaxID=762947 RepID=A0ABS4RC51_9BACI|nr:hypothetical protein [Cytobacillus eiseniae]MBP2240468.1 hypothetical protein [Cytobacillus eiseniae]
MMTNHTEGILNVVKNLGTKVEYELNESILGLMNQPRVLRSVNNQSQIFASTIKRLQQTVESLSIPFNFPTKNDVTNTTKRFIQAEEKLDLLEERVIHLNHSIDDLKDTITASSYRTGEN